MFLHELTAEQSVTFICLAHDIVVSDGVVRADERFMIEQLRREIGLPQDFETHYVPLEGVEKIFDSPRARVSVVINLIRLSYADGAFEIEERFLLEEICRLFEIDEQQFSLIDNWVRRLVGLEEEARTLM